MSTYLGDPEQDKWIAEMKAERKAEEKRLLDCDGDSMIGDLDINDTITFTTPADDALMFRFIDLNEPTELFRIEQDDTVGGDVRLEAGKGTEQDGDIYFNGSARGSMYSGIPEIRCDFGLHNMLSEQTQ